jgi:hypothetical protein
MCVRKELMGHTKKILVRKKLNESGNKKIEKLQSQHYRVPYFIPFWQEFEPLNRFQCLVMIVNPSSC